MRRRIAGAGLVVRVLLARQRPVGIGVERIEGFAQDRVGGGLGTADAAIAIQIQGGETAGACGGADVAAGTGRVDAGGAGNGGSAAGAGVGAGVGTGMGRTGAAGSCCGAAVPAAATAANDDARHRRSE